MIDSGAVETLATADADPRELRAAIARELHDGPIQELTACLVRLEGFRDRSADPAMQDAITAVADHARTALTALRRMIGDLRQEPLQQDLASSVRALIQRVRGGTRAEVALVVSPSWPPLLPGPMAVNLLRIVQEALNNAVRHGGARHILVELTGASDHLEVSVHDDGRGISAGAPAGSGILGMRERAAILGARLTVRHRRPGTEIHVGVPFG